MDKNREIELIKKFLNQHKAEDFKSIHDLYYQSLCYFALGIVKDSQTAEDLVQDAFVTLWENKKNLKSESNLTAYLYTCVKNNCLIFLRKKNIHERFIDSTEEFSLNNWQEDSSLHLIRSEVYREIMKKIDKLPPRMKEIFMLSYISKLKDKEIAERLSISTNSIKTQKKRAKTILRSELLELLNNFIFLFA